MARFGDAHIAATHPLVRKRAVRLGAAVRTLAVVATASSAHALALLGFAGVHAFVPPPAKTLAPSHVERVELHVVEAAKPKA